MKVVIAGSRTYKDYSFFEKELNKLNLNPTEIISGGAHGVDAMAEIYAEHNHIELRVFEADWQLFGRAAGPIRNENMAKVGDVLVAFWDGQSRGTLDMINKMEKKNKPVHIIFVPKG